MGPGAAIKAVSGKYFSLTVFGFAQVAIDIEPLIRILRGENVLHGFTHTYIGAALIGAVSLLVGKTFCEWLLRIWNTITQFKFLKWLQLTPNIPWFSELIGAFIGTFSHVFLDSLIHSDMHPFTPFSTSNNLLYIMPIGWVYLICTGLGVVGFMAIALVSLWNKWAIEIE
jgi:membrane-bound metal-dependent hydrolase YbcI (DUF457 family)